MIKTTLAWIAALGFTAVPSFAANLGYSVQTISFSGDNFTQLLGINYSDTIVGYHGATVNKGFTLTLPATFTDTNFPGSAQTQVTGISSAAGNNNEVGFYVDTAGETHGFINIPGLPSGIGPFFTVDQPGTAFNQVLGISGLSNRIAGYSSTDPTGMTLQHAYIGNAGLFGNAFTDINGLLPANQNSQATGINNAGNAVGFYMPTSDTSIGFLDTAGTIDNIDPFGSTFTQALGINNAGEIVGFYVDPNGVQHGYTDIGGTFSSFDPGGSVSTTINGVNSQGQLVGFATIDDNVVGFVATPTPEPASWTLLGSAGIALMLIGMTRSRRAKKNVAGFPGVKFAIARDGGRAVLGAITCSVFAVGIARGASITETVPFTIPAPSAANLPAQTVIVSTPQFSPTRGVLDSATTTITGTTSTALEFFSTGAGGSYDILLSDTLSLAGIPALFGQELTGTLAANQTVFVLPVAIPFGPVDRTDPAQLVAGSGTWNQLFSLPFPSLTKTQTPASVLVPGLSISGSSVTTYIYTPAMTPVPEPSFSWALALLLGCGLVVTKFRTRLGNWQGLTRVPVVKPS